MSEIKRLTPYEDVDQVLTELKDGLTNLLGDQLVGLYLTGSLTYGDFDPGSSDIDFLVVLSKELSDNQLKALKSVHEKIGKLVPKWAKRLEGSYITKDMLHVERPETERPYVNNGVIKLCRYGNEWIINLYALQETGLALVGAEPKAIFPTVSIDQVREASKQDLHDDWLPKLDDPKAFDQPGYDSAHIKAYTVLTMCRILHRAKNDGIASKRVATVWVKQTYSQWNDLVTQAEQWQHGKTMSSDSEVKDFIRFTKEEVER